MDPMIWIIDDDASIRFVFDRGLEFQHITHRLFENGEAALSALQKEIPDVIVSDIRMPGISGLDLIKAVHEVDENIPFIIITAHSDLTSAVDSYERGTFEYVPTVLLTFFPIGTLSIKSIFLIPSQSISRTVSGRPSPSMTDFTAG